MSTPEEIAEQEFEVIINRISNEFPTGPDEDVPEDVFLGNVASILAHIESELLTALREKEEWKDRASKLQASGK